MIISNRLRLLVVAFCAAAAALCAPAVLAQTGNPAAAHPFAQSKPVAGNYIVVFKNSVRDAAAETANVMNGAGGQVLHVYLHAIKGFAATLPDAALQAIRNNPNVSYIEADQTALPLDSQYHFNDTGAGVHAFIIDTGIRATHTEFGVRVQVGQNFVGTRQGRTVKIDPADTNDCNGHGTHVSGT